MYKKFGFEVDSERGLVVPEEFGTQPDVKIWTMIRKRRGVV